MEGLAPESPGCVKIGEDIRGESREQSLEGAVNAGDCCYSHLADWEVVAQSG